MNRKIRSFLIPLLLLRFFTLSYAQTPELVVQSGHSSQITSLSFSPDGKLLASGGQDGNLVLWDMTTKKQLRVIRAHSRGCSVEFNKSGTRLVSSGTDASPEGLFRLGGPWGHLFVKIWDVGNGRLVDSVQVSQSLSLSMAEAHFSRDSSIVVIATDFEITRRDYQRRTTLSQLQIRLPEGERFLLVHPSGDAFLTRSEDGWIRVRDVRSGSELQRSKIKSDSLIPAAFSPDGKYVVASPYMLGRFINNSIGITASDNIYDGSLFARSLRWTRLGNPVVGPFAFTYDSKWLAVQCGSGMVESIDTKIIDLDQWRIVSTIKIGYGGPLALSPNRNLIAIARADSKIELYDLNASRRYVEGSPHRSRINSIAIDPDGTILATCGDIGDNGQIKFWDARSGAEAGFIDAGVVGAYSLSFSPNGKLFAAVEVSDIVIWDASSLDAVATISPERGKWDAPRFHFNEFRFSNDGRLVAASCLDSMIRVYEVPSGALLRTINVEQGFITSLSFSSGDTMLATGGEDGTAKVWDVRTGKRLRTIKFGRSHDSDIRVGFSPQGGLLAIGKNEFESTGVRKTEDDSVLIVDFEHNVQYALRGNLDRVYAFKFLPRTKRVAALTDTCWKIWNLGTKQELTPIAWKISGKPIYSVDDRMDPALIDAGSKIGAVVCSDGGVRIFDFDVQSQRVLAFKTYLEPRLKVLGNLIDRRSSVDLLYRDSVAMLATAGSNSVRTWDLSSCSVTSTISDRFHEIQGIALDAKTNALAYGNAFGFLRVQNAKTGEQLFSLDSLLSRVRSDLAEEPSYPWEVMRFDTLSRSLAWIHNHRVVRDTAEKSVDELGGTRPPAYVTENVIRTIDLNDQKQQRVLARTQGSIFGIDLSRDGRYLASCSDGALIQVQDFKSGKLLWTSHDRPWWYDGQLNARSFRYLAINPEEPILAVAGSLSDPIRLLDLRNGNQISSFSVDLDPKALKFSPDGRTLAIGFSDGRVDLRNGNPAFGAKLLYDHPFRSRYERVRLFGTDSVVWRWHRLYQPKYAVTPDFIKLVMLDSVVVVRDARSGMILRQLRVPSDSIDKFIISPHARAIAFENNRDSTVVVRMDEDAPSRAFPGLPLGFTLHDSVLATSDWGKVHIVNILKDSVLFDIDKPGNLVNCSPNGFFGATYRSTVKVWSMESHSMRWSVDVANLGAAIGFWFSSDGGVSIALFDISAGKQPDKCMKAWDTKTGMELWTETQIQDVKPTDAPDVIRFVKEKKTVFFNVRTKRAVAETDYDGPFSLPVSISGDGNTLVLTDGSKCIVKEIPTGRELGRFSCPVLTDVFLSEDGSQVLGQVSGEARLISWDISGLEKTRVLEGSGSGVRMLAYSPDGRKLAASYEDGTVALWDMRSLKKLATIVSVDTADYVIVTPDGYYKASKGGLNGVAFRLGNKVYPFEQFDLKFNRPDKVIAAIGYAPEHLIRAYRAAHEKRVKKLGFEEASLSGEFHLPEIHMLSEIPPTTNEKNLLFKVRASDSQKYLIRSIKVLVNSVPESANYVKNEPTKSELDATIEVQLSDGPNEIQISALNEKGAESLRENFEITYTGPPAQPDLYVVAIGVSNYRDTVYNLKYADTDAKSIAGFFDGVSKRFAKVHITSILNSAATRERIVQVRDSLKLTKPDDEVILFYAGHGVLDDSLNYYLATTDIDFNKPSLRGLAYEDLEGIVDGILARKKLVLIDACHSGELEKDEASRPLVTRTSEGEVVRRNVGGSRGVEKEGLAPLGVDATFEMMKDLFADLRNGSGAVVISASSGAEYALERSSLGHGVFTYSVLKGLESNRKVSELRDFVFANVQALTAGRQRPTSRRENLEFDFNIW